METSKRPFAEETCGHCRRSQAQCLSSNPRCDACGQCKSAVNANGDDYKTCGTCFWLSNGSGSSSVPPAAKPEESSLPSHVSRVECHNCRTLGLECTTVHKDTKCDRCLLIGMDCDPEALRWRYNNCTSGRCSTCGKDVYSTNIGGLKLFCLQCRKEERKPGTFALSQSSAKGVLVKDGQVMRTCIGCFQPNLDPGSMTSFCERCENLRLKAENNTSPGQNLKILKSEPSPAHETHGLSWSGGKLWTDLKKQSPTSSNWKFTSCTSCQMYGLSCDYALPVCTACKEREGSACRYQYKNPIISKQATATCIGCYRVQSKSPRDFVNGFCPECKALRPAGRGKTLNSDNTLDFPQIKSSPVPCIMCRRNSLSCDQALPACTQCKERQGTACDYRHIKERIKYGSTSNQCLTCGPAASYANNTGYCEQCLTLPSTTKSLSTSQNSKIEESKSEIPRFIDFVNTRLEDLRLGCPRPPTPIPSFPPTLAAHPVLSSPPAATTTCLACLDKVITCALHPKPQNFGIFSTIEAARAVRDRDPSLAIPCLACFDEETSCANHEKPEGIHKTKRALKVAQACGSCRLAGEECDETRSGCGNCKEKGWECLYIRGGEPLSANADSDVLPGHKDAEDVPQLPRACGSCRMANVECDEVKPGCKMCKEKGLDCMYITGFTPPSPEPVSVILARVTEEDENQDLTDESNPRLDESVILHPATVDSQQSLDGGESQLDDSVILAAACEDDLDLVEEGESQMDELETEDWDLVSQHEDYEVVEAAKKLGNESDEELDGGFKFL